MDNINNGRTTVVEHRARDGEGSTDSGDDSSIVFDWDTGPLPGGAGGTGADGVCLKCNSYVGDSQ